MNPKTQTSLGSLYELKSLMANRLRIFKKKFPEKETSELDNMIELLNSGIEQAEYLRLSCQWLQEELNEWEAFTDPELHPKKK